MSRVCDDQNDNGNNDDDRVPLDFSHAAKNELEHWVTSMASTDTAHPYPNTLPKHCALVNSTLHQGNIRVWFSKFLPFNSPCPGCCVFVVVGDTPLHPPHRAAWTLIQVPPTLSKKVICQWKRWETFFPGTHYHLCRSEINYENIIPGIPTWR